MTRLMIDAASPANIPQAIKKQLVAGYLTGTPGQRWTGHWSEFPGMTMVTIDQGSPPGNPAYSANVMDVEPRCYRPPDIEPWMHHAVAPRPTVYCDRNDYPEVRKVWSGDIWLADPSDTPVVPYPDDKKIVAVQYTQGPNYDASIVFDDTWPNAPAGSPPMPPIPNPMKGNDERMMLHGMLTAGGQEFVPFAVGSFVRIQIFHDFTNETEPMRVAAHSVSKGYSQIVDVAVTNSAPVSLAFGEHDVNGVSLVNRSKVAMGWTLDSA